MYYLTGTRKKEEDALYDQVDKDAGDEDENTLTPHEKILIGRKRLPIYAYREEFLEAVRDNKIIVVVGETGSGNRYSILDWVRLVWDITTPMVAIFDPISFLFYSVL